MSVWKAVLLWMEEHRPKKRKENIRAQMRGDYRQALGQINSMLSNMNSRDEKCAVLDFAIKAVKRDIIGSGLAGFVYSPEAPEWPDVIPVPDGCTEIRPIEIDLSKASILAVPHKYSSLEQSIRTLLHERFEQKKSHYTGDYYPELDLVAIENGHHHVAVASLGRGGTITVTRIRHLTSAFEFLSTDGASWTDTFNSEAGSIIHKEVEDFRFALLYILAKMRHELKDEVHTGIGVTSKNTAFNMQLGVARENGADLHAALVRYREAYNISEHTREMIKLLEDQVFADTQQLLKVKDQEDLERIQGAFDFVRTYLSRLQAALPDRYSLRDADKH